MLFSLSLVEGCGSIAFCSDPMHAARARRYALAQRPELRDSLVSADDYRLFERWWIKLPCTLYELWRNLRNRGRTTRRAGNPTSAPMEVGG